VIPPGLWGPKEFAGMTDDELHQVTMGSGPGSNYFEWAKAELAHRDRRRQMQPMSSELLPPLVNNFFGAVGNVAQNSHDLSLTATVGIQPLDLARLVKELTGHFDELNLEPRQKLKAEAQIATLRAQLADEPDPVIVQQAGRTLRNITEGAIGSLLATATQPSVWEWIHRAIATFT
jgi:hypothetical protein